MTDKCEDLRVDYGSCVSIYNVFKSNAFLCYFLICTLHEFIIAAEYNRVNELYSGINNPSMFIMIEYIFI